MRVLVIGGGGREHAIAWACEQHGHTVTMASELGDVTVDDVDLVIPGPESALVAGIADECSFRKIPCFGPTSKQARSAEAKHLFQLGGIDVYELLKAMEWPNYALVAQRVMQQQTQAAASEGTGK